MCNPRRIEIRATRRIEEAWYASVQQSVTRGDIARGESRAREPIDMSFTPEIISLLEAQLAADPAWVQAGSEWHYALPAGEVIYHAGDRELEIIGRHEQAVRVTGTGSVEDRGVVTQQIETTEHGMGYNDMPSINERKERELRARAEQSLDQQSAEAKSQMRGVADAKRREAERRLAEGARREAAARAEQQLATILEGMQDEVDREAVMRLVEVGNAGRYAFNSLLAQACRQFFENLAGEHQGSQMQTLEDETSITIEVRIPSKV